jgi:hypothetical protein
MSSFKAGATQVKITPPLGTAINGDFYTHYVLQIHDDLYAKALFLQQADKMVLLIVVDICTMSQAYLDIIKSKISAECNIPASSIMISSTHTHAAGAVEEVYLGAADLQYRSYLIDLVVRSATMAQQQLRPAKIAHGEVDIPDYVKCRRYWLEPNQAPYNPVTGRTDKIKTNPFGLEEFIIEPVSETDSQLSFLAIKDLDDRWISILGNYSLHYVGDWPNGTITADFFGAFADHLTSKLRVPKDFVGIMTNGTSGDINIWNFDTTAEKGGYFQKSILIGSALADQVVTSLQDCRWSNQVDLDIESIELTLTVRKPNQEELSEAENHLDTTALARDNYSREALTIIYAREQVLLDASPEVRTCLLQGIKIGEVKIGTLPGEFFAETGLALKKTFAHTPYFTIGLANGNVGYVPPMAQFALGGYETWRSRYSCLQPEAEDIIRSSLIALIKNMM